MNAALNAILEAETSRLEAARAAAAAAIAVAEALPKYANRATKVAKAKAQLKRVTDDFSWLAALRAKVATAPADATIAYVIDLLPVTSDYFSVEEDDDAISEALAPSHTAVIAASVFKGLRAYAPELDGFWVVYRALMTDATTGRERFEEFIRKRVATSHPSAVQAQRLRTIFEFLRLLGHNVMDPFNAGYPLYLRLHSLADPTADKKKAFQTAREYVGAHLMNLPLKTYNKYKRDVEEEEDAE
jgi:hypothetical protein